MKNGKRNFYWNFNSAIVWQGVAAIADCFGGGEVSEKVGCGIFYFGYIGIKKLIGK